MTPERQPIAPRKSVPLEDINPPIGGDVTNHDRSPLTGQKLMDERPLGLPIMPVQVVEVSDEVDGTPSDTHQIDASGGRSPWLT